MPLRPSGGPEEDPEEHAEPLNDAERAWLESSLRAAHEFIARAGIEPDGAITPESLDALWEWLPRNVDDPNVAISVTGLALGQLLAERLGFEWIALTDQHGTEVAVRGSRDLTVFPTNFVAKRFQASETGFIAGFVSEIERVARGA